MNAINLTTEQYYRFEHQVAYARQDGAALYESKAPATIVDGDDNNEEDCALLAAGLLHRDDGYYTFTQVGWDYARNLHS